MPEKGKVKWFSNVKGYGFLTKEGAENPDIFVHYSAVLGDGYKTLVSGEDVSFEIIEGNKGPTAKNVVRAKKPPKAVPEAKSVESAAEKKAEG